MDPRLFELCGHPAEDAEVVSHIYDSRVKVISPWITKEGCNIIDLGCGSGIFFLNLLETNPSAIPWGIDRSLEAIEAARTIFPNFKKNFIHGNILGIPVFKRETFDVVLCSAGLLAGMPASVLEWVANGDAAFLYIYQPLENFKSLEEFVLSLGYTSSQLNESTVKLISKINK